MERVPAQHGTEEVGNRGQERRLVEQREDRGGGIEERIRESRHGQRENHGRGRRWREHVQSDSDMQVPVLLNFLSDVPFALTTVLVQLAPYFSCIRSLIDIISWKTPWYESWLLIALWWFICLLGDLLLRSVVHSSLVPGY